jgi:hypothetical protein
MAAENLEDFMHSGYVRITWTNSGIPANFYAYRVYRRVSGGARQLLFQTTANQSSYSYNDYNGPANIPVDYDVVAVRLVNSVQTEEAASWSTITPIDNHYWITHPTNPSIALRLQHVTEDSFSFEQEKETMTLIGRGRKEDRGDVLGVTGSLTFELRDVTNGQTARDQKASLLSMVQTAAPYLLLRTPFGDLWQVSFGTPEFSRTAGVGLHEMTTVTMSYEEIR